MTAFFEGISGFWLCVGFISQAMFFSRFLIQWIVSEIKKKSVIPVAFWHLSIFGAIGLLAYSLYRRDPVFIAGNSIGLMVYSRNLYFIYKNPQDQIKELKADIK